MRPTLARYINVLKKPIIFSPILLGMGYGMGSFNEKRTSSDPAHAVSVIQNQPGLTWKLKYFSSGQYSQGGRDGLWVTRFKPRYTGIRAFVVFHEKKTGQSFLLLTLQERVINKQKTIVCEPPMGFYNGTYASSIPHAVTESAEREIEKQIKLGNTPNQKKIYSEMSMQYKKESSDSKSYQVDANLQETALREIEEEAGLNLKQLQSSGFSLHQIVMAEDETPDFYASIRRLDITGDALPTLKKRNNDEVMHNEWIPLSNIDLQTGMVKTSKGTYPLKPYDKVIECTQQIIKDSLPSHRASKK